MNEEITWPVPEPGEGKEYEILPEDSYAATLWAVKTVDKPDWMRASDQAKPDYDADTYDTQQWEWIFEVQDEEYQGQRLSAYMNRSLHPKSNGFRFMVPLLGRVPEPGETIGFGQLVGLALQNHRQDQGQEGRHAVQQSDRRTGSARSPHASAPRCNPTDRRARARLGGVRL